MSEKPIFKKTQNELTEEERIIVENHDPLYLAVYNNTVDQMYELTDEMKQFMEKYPYRSQDEVRDPRQIKVMTHFFNPVACQDWIFTEHYDYQNGRHYFYGCARLFDDIGWEWGVMPTLEELKRIDLGPAFGHLRIERDMSVEVGDSLYDVMMGIDQNGLYDLGLMSRSLEDPELASEFEKQKFALLRNVIDDEMFDKVTYYLKQESVSIDDVFDIDSYYYDRDNCFAQEKIDEYYETHEFPGLDVIRDGLSLQNAETEVSKDFMKTAGKDSSMNFGKEL